MSKFLTYTVAAAFIASAGFPALAAPAPADETAAQHNADRDFGKLSADGVSALRDVRLVRLDIFDGRIDSAKTDLAKAIASLSKAQSDETVFTKAESELKPPSNMPTKPQTASSSSPVQWVPVDGAMTLGEDDVATPEKTASVAKANGKLAQGDKKGAMDDLKLAGVDVVFIVELAPLKATVSGVQHASDLLNAGKYYEANQSLKSVEDGLRFDNEVLIATPQKASAAQPPKTSN